MELLEGFIKKYVQCYSCGNPETVVRLKRDLVSLKCKACGAVSDVDARHKLNTYIINHPPEEVLSKAEKKLKKLEAERLQQEGGSGGAGGGGDGAEPSGSLGAAASLGKTEKKEKKEKKKKDKDKKGKRSKSTEAEGGGGGGGGGSRASPDGDNDDDESGGSGGSDEDDDDDVVWATDTSAAAAAARAKDQLSEAMAAMVTLADGAKDARARAVVEVRGAAGKAGATPAAVLEACAAAAAAAGLTSPADRTALLVESLLLGGSPDAKYAATAAGVAPIFGAAAPDAAGQMALAVGLERALGVAAPADRTPEAGAVFKALYDADVLEEGIISGWAGAGGAGAVVGVPPDRAAAVRAAVAPFVSWLAEASSEEEESESE